MSAYEKLQKTTISFVMSVFLSVRSSVRMEQLVCHWKEFHELTSLSIFREVSRKFEFNLNLTRIMGTLHDHLCTFMMASGWIILRKRNASGCRENQNTHFMFSNFFSLKSCRLWDNVEKYGRARQATDDNIIRRMWFACWITKAIDTHSEYVIVISFFHANSGLANAPQCCVYTYIPYLVVFILIRCILNYVMSVIKLLIRRRIWNETVRAKSR